RSRPRGSRPRSTRARAPRWALADECGLEHRAIVLEFRRREPCDLADVVVAPQADRVAGVGRALELGDLGGFVRTALEIERVERRRRELLQVRRVGRAEVALRGDMHPDRLCDLRAEMA